MLYTEAFFKDFGNNVLVLAPLLYFAVTLQNNLNWGWWAIGRTCGGYDLEFLWVFYNVGFYGGIDPTATSSINVFVYILV